MEVGELVEGEILSLAFGGQGILRHQGLVIFVPYTAIGDIISCRIETKKKTFAIGQLVHIIKPSKDRATPFCSYYGTCGGCQLQHLTYSAQLEYKKQSIIDAFQRIGQLEIKPFCVEPAIENKFYRRHITLHLKANQGGFYANDNQTIIPIQTCPIFNQPNDPILQIVQQMLAKLTHLDGKLIIIKQAENQYLLQFSFELLPTNYKEILQLHPNIVGVNILTKKETFSVGQTLAQCTINDLFFEFSPQAFIQNHPEQSLKIYQTIIETAKKVGASEILDLYCGIGILSLLMGKEGFKVLGVELNPIAVNLAKENAQNNNINNVNFQCAAVEKVLSKLFQTKKIDFTIINPPRTGVDEKVIRSLTTYPTKNLIYVSCMPTTLARDLKHLCKNGYEIEMIKGFDMFPQTGHMETLVHLKSLSMGKI